jgi:hypothetical protein
MATATATATKNGTAIGSISDKAVFLSIHFSRFYNIRKVETSQVEVDADKRRIGVTKKLLESKTLQEIQRLDYEAMRYIESRCLPFEKGIHALPNGLIEEVDDSLRERDADRNRLVDQFVAEYDDLLNEARRPLGALFDAGDYPTAEETRAYFGMRWNYLSLSTPGSLKELSPKLFQEERRKIGEKMQESYEEWRTILRVAMADLVKRLRESLQPGPDGKTRKLTDSSVNRLQDFLQTFSFRNVTNDEELEKVCEELKVAMTGVTVEQLRESERLKEKMGKSIAEAAATLDVMTQGIRKLRSEEE